MDSDYELDKQPDSNANRSIKEIFADTVWPPPPLQKQHGRNQHPREGGAIPSKPGKQGRPENAMSAAFRARRGRGGY